MTTPAQTTTDLIWEAARLIINEGENRTTNKYDFRLTWALLYERLQNATVISMAIRNQIDRELANPDFRNNFGPTEESIKEIGEEWYMTHARWTPTINGK
jgi:hypothetical protein